MSLRCCFWLSMASSSGLTCAKMSLSVSVPSASAARATSSSSTAVTNCWLGSFEAASPCIPTSGAAFGAHRSAAPLDSVPARRATGSSFSLRFKSSSWISLRSAHSRSPCWWPHAPHLVQRTLRSSTPKGLCVTSICVVYAPCRGAFASRSPWRSTSRSAGVFSRDCLATIPGGCWYMKAIGAVGSPPFRVPTNSRFACCCSNSRFSSSFLRSSFFFFSSASKSLYRFCAFPGWNDLLFRKLIAFSPMATCRLPHHHGR
mmetsp:Transcript_34789/g.86537  ORF Transcript_34789/g.86537 Transcript_34789/m.86537 type:complete len:259 (-) Transcript_34789:3-779(-)